MGKKKKDRKEFRFDSNDFGLVWAGVSDMVSNKANVWSSELFVADLLLFEHQQKTAL